MTPLSSSSERDVLILRDPRESVHKCSLTPLRGMPGVRFVDGRPGVTVEGEGRVLLHPDGEPLARADAGRGLLLIDCSWRRLPKLFARVHPPFVLRRLPELATAYPRASKTFPDPAQGLASVEALFAARALLGAWDEALLAAYRWSDEFLRANPELVAERERCRPD
jgi:pre-rRNA-processing protein TSR3